MYTNSGNAGLDYQTDYFVFNEKCEMESKFSFSCSEYAFDENGNEYRPEVTLGKFYINDQEFAEYPCLPVISCGATYKGDGAIEDGDTYKGDEAIEDDGDGDASEDVESRIRSAQSFEAVLKYFKSYPVLALLLQNVKSQKDVLNMMPFSFISDVWQNQFCYVNYPPFPSDYLIDCSMGA